MNFADHKDLRKLNCIRVVDPDVIRMPSKESTIGCYQPARGSRKAEIWISSELVKANHKVDNFLNKIKYRDMHFETLFHELGHHKAKLVHSVDRFEDEAFAEKYMLAYKKCWKEHYGPSKLYIAFFRSLLKFLRLISIGILYPFRRKNKELDLFYRATKGEINNKEFIQELSKLSGHKETDTQKKKWTHPLSKKKYRERFKVADR